jgi:very-short-patch-repair endonuclease
MQDPFDVVIFDEASQIPTWDAIGAIARGKQTVIVGDPKQLPPTNFFGKTDDDEFDDELEDHEKDLESILDEALASGLPELTLNWHYRSRHESLIAFSNYKYYRNELITFPSAEDEEKGVALVKVADAVYDRGKSRTNQNEAQAIVDDAVRRMKANLDRPSEKRLTFGVITFNTQQQTLIQDLFDAARRKSPEIEWFFNDARIEPTVVKNLENVQGDERDVMYFSITFGPTATNPNISLNFGALNRDGGERRLNVAVTRARQQMLVYSSFTADQLDASRSKSVGLNHLKQFLEFAESGGEKPLDGQTEDSVGGFEQSVFEALELRGWQVLSQIGVSGFRIDLGVRHPDKPGAYLAGVECDGATYHRSAAARDRDKTRQLVLEGLGWNILRIWSPNWWYAKEEVINRLDEQLNELLEIDRTGTVEVDSFSELDDDLEPDEDVALQSETFVKPQDQSKEKEESLVVRRMATSGSKLAPEKQTAAVSLATYIVLDLGDCSSAANQFHDADYRETLRSMSQKILNAQGPIREDVLASQIARAHGFKRTGAKIRDHILEQIRGCPATEEGSGRFLWSWDHPIEASIPFRLPADELDSKERRSIAEISVAELCGLVQSSFKEISMVDDPVVFLARKIGVGRVSQPARARIADAISRARELRDVT